MHFRWPRGRGASRHLQNRALLRAKASPRPRAEAVSREARRAGGRPLRAPRWLRPCCAESERCGTSQHARRAVGRKKKRISQTEKLEAWEKPATEVQSRRAEKLGAVM